MLKRKRREKSTPKQRKDNMQLEFIPFKGVGSFSFGRSIEEYKNHDFVFELGEDSTDWNEYQLENNGLYIYVEDGLIVSINCNKECWLKGVNLIGHNIYDFSDKFKLSLEDREVDQLYDANSDEDQDVYEFDELGIQIWSFQGVIRTVICSPQMDD